MTQVSGPHNVDSDYMTSLTLTSPLCILDNVPVSRQALSTLKLMAGTIKILTLAVGLFTFYLLFNLNNGVYNFWP